MYNPLSYVTTETITMCLCVCIYSKSCFGYTGPVQTVIVQVIGSTQDPPFFERESYNEHVLEAEPFNTTVGTVEAENPDNGNNSIHLCSSPSIAFFTFFLLKFSVYEYFSFMYFTELNYPQYHIIGGNEGHYFGVDITTGRIFVMSNLLVDGRDSPVHFNC